MSMNQIPRPEHPEPIWERSSWENLNGTWEFAFDHGRSARDRGLYRSEEKLPLEILVPFCPESRLSGIEYKDFIDAVCYRRHFEISKERLDGRIFLHFGAVDYKAYVYINGELAGTHLGGYASFALDITKLVREGDNTVFVWALDDIRSGRQPRGKQSGQFASAGCDYTRTTGIWQTVWLEFLPMEYIKYAKYFPDVNAGTLTVIGETVGKGKLSIASSYEGVPTGSAEVDCVGGGFTATIKLTEKHLWELGKGGLYDLVLTFGDDTVKSYFGLRSIALDGMKFRLNGKSVFQRLVLDQGFYPDGIYTAPTDADLEKDIELSMACGFNGARLHQKVFEARFLYYADRHGYMVWDEMGNWGFDCGAAQATEIYLNEWMEVVARDFDHPSVIGWCPFNETWSYMQKDGTNTLLSTIYNMTKMYDPTRPVIDTSGGYHFVTDIYDVHDYDQNPDNLRKHYEKLSEGEIFDWLATRTPSMTQKWKGEPVFVSEYGGIGWKTDGTDGWGYGKNPEGEEEFVTRFTRLTHVLLDNPLIMGFCYTQLYDIEQEINGLYTYERVPKFDVAQFKRACEKKAAVED